MLEQTLETIDQSNLTAVTGGNSYVKECYKGALTGAAGGSVAGPKGAFFGGILGCLAGMGANAIERNW
jgi:hypothetical protein